MRAPDTVPPELTAGQRLARLLRLQVFYGFFATLHWCLGYRFLVLERGFSIEGALLVAGVVYVMAALLLLVLPRMEMRRALRLGFLFRILTIVPYAFFPTDLGIFVASVSFGIALIMFWIPYNIIFFEHREKTNKAGISAVYAAIAPFTDVLATLIAGWMVVHYGYPALFTMAIVLGVMPFVVSFRLTPRHAMPISLWPRMRRIPRLKTIIFLNGINQGVLWPSVPLVTLFFIDGTFAYAGFFAVLGLVGALAAVLLGRLSDRRAKRLLFMLPFALLYGLANLLSSLAVTIVQWGVWRGLSTFSSALFDPFQNAVLLDKADDVADLYVAREFLLNTGRALGVGLVLPLAHFGFLQLALLVPAAVGFVLPVLIEAKDLYPEERLVLKPFRAMFRQ